MTSDENKMEATSASKQSAPPPPQVAVTTVDIPPQPPSASDHPAAAGAPPGLEYLALLDQVLVQQQVELVEALVGFEGENKYVIKNVSGQQCYFAAEQSGCCSRQCCASRRSFTIKILDNLQREVIHVKRSFNCCAQTCCWLPCVGMCQHEIVVESPPGVEIGRVHNSCGVFRSKFDVMLGDDDEQIAYIKAPLCIHRGCLICLDVSFTVYSSSTDEEIGSLKKQYSGMLKEAFTDADNFSLTFPRDLDVRAKAILLSTVFLIDFMYFEKKAEAQVNIQRN
ncbi:phospholipid scramblase 1-like [Convolutriloba macropyga]|uniref:phospholipid scramblase 1-like n=1 Tax=Convolutriloba macropyga TaxID=536237 RepID=UPI003F51F482